MKQILAAVVAVSAITVSPAMAQNCATGTGMSPSQIQTLVSNKYACVGSSPNAQWNELHNSSGTTGSVLDYKLGPTSTTDPSDTASHPTGQYSIKGDGNSGHPGTITYTYGAQSFAYTVIDNLTHPQYSFCGTGGAPPLAVTISAAHC